LAQTITCNSPATVTSQPIATVSVYDPDCLTISKKQTVVWCIMASKSYSYNDGPFGSCDNVDNPEINLRGNKEGQILPKTPHTLLDDTSFIDTNEENVTTMEISKEFSDMNQDLLIDNIPNMIGPKSTSSCLQTYKLFLSI
ncbi:17805_t:CDS:2, partial [Rhizophagus irregularis]